MNGTMRIDGLFLGDMEPSGLVDYCSEMVDQLHRDRDVQIAEVIKQLPRRQWGLAYLYWSSADITNFGWQYENAKPGANREGFIVAPVPEVRVSRFKLRMLPQVIRQYRKVAAALRRAEAAGDELPQVAGFVR